VRGPAAHALGEPQGDLVFCALHSVRAVADVASDLDAQVAADGARGGLGGLGCSEHHTASLDGVLALPNHAAHGAGHHVVDEAAEEALGGQVGVVLLQQLAGRGGEFHSLQLEAFGFEACDDLTDEASLHAVRLDHDVSALHGGE